MADRKRTDGLTQRGMKNGGLTSFAGGLILLMPRSQFTRPRSHALFPKESAVLSRRCEDAG